MIIKQKDLEKPRLLSRLGQCPIFERSRGFFLAPLFSVKPNSSKNSKMLKKNYDGVVKLEIKSRSSFEDSGNVPKSLEVLWQCKSYENAMKKFGYTSLCNYKHLYKVNLTKYVNFLTSATVAMSHNI